MTASLPAIFVELRAAVQRFASPELAAEAEHLLQERKKYPSRIVYRSEYIRGRQVKLSNQSAHRAYELDLALQANSRAKIRDLIVQLKDGRLIGYACAGPFEPWERVPPSAWDDLMPDLNDSTVKDRNGKVYNVRIAEATAIEEEATRNDSPKSTEPVAPGAREADTRPQEPVEISFDTDRSELVLSGVCVLTRANYKLLKALYDQTSTDVHGDIPANNRRFVSSYALADLLDLDEATVRARVTAIRNKLAKVSPERFGNEQQRQLLIESHDRSGYRFHWAVRFIALNKAVRVKPQRKTRKTTAQKNNDH